MHLASWHVAIRLPRAGGGPTTAIVAGELDLACADELAAILCRTLDDSPTGLRIDLGGVEFCDCAGLRALLRARKFARDHGRSFTLERSSPAMDLILRITDTRLAPATGDPAPDIRSA
jgi:anti-anti-sigma factor